MNILIDALSMSFKFDNVYKLMSDLHLVDVVRQPMRTRYYSNGEYYEGILIAYNMDEHGYITDTFLDVSGKGCRTIEILNPAFKWRDFFLDYDEDIRNKTVHISRIDIACDVMDKSLNIDIIREYAMDELYVCRSKVLPDVRYKRTEEVYFGSPRSDRLLRIYNKALERGLPDTDWIRLEFQLRNDNATSFYLNWCHLSDIGKLYSGMMLDYLRFVDPGDKDIEQIKKNCNQHRLETVWWWRDFLSAAERIPQLYLPDPEFTILNLERYLEKQTYSSLKAYLIAHDGDITKLMEGVDEKKLNHKQRVLLQQLGKIEKHEYEQ